MNQLTFRRIGYVKVQIGNKILNRTDSKKVIRTLRYHNFKIGQEVTINPSDKYHQLIYQNILDMWEVS